MSTMQTITIKQNFINDKETKVSLEYHSTDCT